MGSAYLDLSQLLRATEADYTAELTAGGSIFLSAHWVRSTVQPLPSPATPSTKPITVSDPALAALLPPPFLVVFEGQSAGPAPTPPASAPGHSEGEGEEEVRLASVQEEIVRLPRIPSMPSAIERARAAKVGMEI